MSRAEDETRSAGRGVLLIGAAKILFIVGGYAVTLALPRIFEERVYGLFQVAFGAIAILNNVLIASTIQTVAKLVSESDERAGPALRQGLKIQAAVGATLALAVALGAPLLAEKVLLDPELTPLLRIASIVVLVYSLYAPLVGSLNGRRLFQRQAALDMSFTVLRTIGLIGGAAI
ncbi:MAG: oligosaccharide flippase family protein, partial [Sandaracinaceae bacterium]|nr:oligosaccharide flippase family protein [Sandaracinaceae bacterium]